MTGTMTAPVDPSPFGQRMPDSFVRATMAFTRALPGNRFGFKLAMPFRRMAIDSLGSRPVDTDVWGARVRLYPSRNICEKNALFTPQAFDVLERSMLADAIDRRVAAGAPFTFVDIGANVGLYSLFVGACAAACGGRAHILAIEPQPGILDRLSFNRALNPGLDITILPVAVADQETEAEFVLRRDPGGSHLNKSAEPVEDAEVVRVPCRPLASILREAGIASIDALKIDIEGAEDLALRPFLRDAATDLLPRLLLIEDRSDWQTDLYGLLRERGYARAAQSRHNVVFALP
jgi:FkbM family methyltransferase